MANIVELRREVQFMKACVYDLDEHMKRAGEALQRLHNTQLALLALCRTPITQQVSPVVIPGPETKANRTEVTVSIEDETLRRSGAIEDTLEEAQQVDEDQNTAKRLSCSRVRETIVVHLKVKVNGLNIDVGSNEVPGWLKRSLCENGMDVGELLLDAIQKLGDTEQESSWIDGQPTYGMVHDTLGDTTDMGNVTRRRTHWVDSDRVWQYQQRARMGSVRDSIPAGEAHGG